VIHDNSDRLINNLEQLAAFCFQKLAGLEARFIILCHRAQAAGIDCSDLCGPHPAAGSGAPQQLQLMD